MTAYTKKEATTIRDAWQALHRFAGCHGSDDWQLDDSLAREARQVGSRPTAKALLLRTLADAHDMTPQLLWTVRGPHRDLVAYAWRHHDALVEAGIMYKARQAGDAEEKAVRRQLDATLSREV